MPEPTPTRPGERWSMGFTLDTLPDGGAFRTSSRICTLSFPRAAAGHDRMTTPLPRRESVTIDIMPVGTCALCLQTRELRDTHFLPAGCYRIMREGSGEDPVLVNKSAAFISSAQARAHLLCGECEHRFNNDGENWVKNCWRSPTDFPVHSALSAATPLVDEQGFRVYEGKKIPGVEIDKLAYFGASILLASGSTKLDGRKGEGRATAARTVSGSAAALPAWQNGESRWRRPTRDVERRARRTT
jgi:hypothetical protein